MSRFVYADNAATTPMSESVYNAMKPWLTEFYGNPSSLYRIGNEARRAMQDARAKVAKALNAADPSEIIFTGGGSQADNLAITGFVKGASARCCWHIITSRIEHHAVLYTCEALEDEGFTVTYLDVDKQGHVDLEQLKNAISDNTALVTIMAANNEIGTIQDLKAISEIAHAHGALFHTDAVQAVCDMHIDVQAMGIDMLSLSANNSALPRASVHSTSRRALPSSRLFTAADRSAVCARVPKMSQVWSALVRQSRMRPVTIWMPKWVMSKS